MQLLRASIEGAVGPGHRARRGQRLRLLPVPAGLLSSYRPEEAPGGGAGKSPPPTLVARLVTVGGLRAGGGSQGRGRGPASSRTLSPYPPGAHAPWRLRRLCALPPAHRSVPIPGPAPARSHARLARKRRERVASACSPRGGARPLPPAAAGAGARPAAGCCGPRARRESGKVCRLRRREQVTLLLLMRITFKPQYPQHCRFSTAMDVRNARNPRSSRHVWEPCLPLARPMWAQARLQGQHPHVGR